MSIEVRLVETPPRSATLKTPTQWVLRRGSVEPTLNPPGADLEPSARTDELFGNFWGRAGIHPGPLCNRLAPRGRDEKRTTTGEETPEPTRPKSRDEPQSRRHDDG